MAPPRLVNGMTVFLPSAETQPAASGVSGGAGVVRRVGVGARASSQGTARRGPHDRHRPARIVNRIDCCDAMSNAA